MSVCAVAGIQSLMVVYHHPRLAIASQINYATIPPQDVHRLEVVNVFQIDFLYFQLADQELFRKLTGFEV